MSSDRLASVVTTIQPPTLAVTVLADHIQQIGGSLLIIGDRKGPEEYPLPGTEFCSLREQQGLGYQLARALPVDHYARKNLGYLLAIARGSGSIYETDDDNAPMTGWTPRLKMVKAVAAQSREWLNAYHHFCTHRIWPRGFPLDEIAVSGEEVARHGAAPLNLCAPIQQGLANGSPDVDAIWRLVLDKPVTFEANPSVWLPPGTWCPFNSQSTWWWPEAYSLMYLPSYCSFRMTDIWRSFVAQRCLWELGYGVVFHAAEVFQERNEHNLMRDFTDEVEGYLRNKEMARILTALSLKAGPGHQAENLLTCYEALVAYQFFPEKELDLVNAWLADMERIQSKI